MRLPGEYHPGMNGVSLFAGEFMWLTTDEAARRLGMKPDSVRKAATDGRIPYQEFGREIAIRDRDVEAYREKMGRTGRPAQGYSKS